SAAGDGRGVVCATVAGPPGPATAVPAVPVPATVLPQAASPIMRPAAMPPSVARVAAPRGLPSVIIATPSAPRNLEAVPAAFARRGSRRDPRGRPRPPGPAPRPLRRGRAPPTAPPPPRAPRPVGGGTRPPVPVPAAGAGAGGLGCPEAARTDLDGFRRRLVPVRPVPSGPGQLTISGRPVARRVPLAGLRAGGDRPGRVR